MKHLVEIDDGTKAGETLLNLAEILSKENKSIKFVLLNKIEEVTDFAFAKEIEDGLKSDTISRSEVMKALDR